MTEWEERLKMIYEEINRKRDIVKVQVIEEFIEVDDEMEDTEIEKESIITRESVDESGIDGDESESMDDKEDGIEDLEEYEEDRKNMIVKALE